MRASAVLIGFLDHDNLGLGYVAGHLIQHGFAARIVDLREDQASILQILQQQDPVLVGFSVIFQYFVPRFHELASYLRTNRITCHFTAGGHYPSLRYEETLRDIPELDSIVRFEGELTATELMEHLVKGGNWHQLQGIAYRRDDRYVSTAPRPLIDDLDELPYPIRPQEPKFMILGKRVNALLASRGCSRACSFCSIREFYGQAPGRKVRVRRPVNVVQEMKHLHEENGTTIFLFQDDDFPIWGKFGRTWVSEFVHQLDSEGLIGKVLWKISCRSDEVDSEVFSRLRDAGLYMVYLGIESGTEDGLRVLNKRLTPEDSLRAVEILKALRLAFGFGFMLFEPASTFENIRTNLVFLRKLTEEGCAPVMFARMLPYAGTPIENELKDQGRLRGGVEDPDYDFLDYRIRELFSVVNSMIANWIRDPDALAYQISFAWLEYWVMTRLFPEVHLIAEYERLLRSTTSVFNEYVLRLVEGACNVFEFGEGDVPSVAQTEAAGAAILQRLVQERHDFMISSKEDLLARV